MKFGKDLRANMIPEWEAQYIDYRKLKTHIKKIQSQPTRCCFNCGMLNYPGMAQSRTKRMRRRRK